MEIVLGLLSLRGVAGVWLALLHSADVVQTGAGHAAGCGALLNTTSNKDGIALHRGWMPKALRMNVALAAENTCTTGTHTCLHIDLPSISARSIDPTKRP